MCIFCGRRLPKGALLRLALDEAGRVVADPEQRRPGRGAYLCGEEACFRRALTLKGRRRLISAFRGRAREISPDLLDNLAKRGGLKGHE
ncbi:YlxR family protein [Thermosulfurimonas marina]|uniref:YlxR family protein n=2 Tax=Thermosulfurimonas marina TaxID=2047767 RepID=A0A6H1WUY7_9BACT|nr:YlxR family protein [Thermosulfurimonas marina]